MTIKLKPYDNYKKVNLPWLDKIPSHWVMTRNKNVMELKKDTVGDNHGNYTLLSLTKQGIIPRDLENAKGKFPKEFNSYQIVQPLDLVFCLFDVDETPRTVGVSSLEGMITGAYTVFTPKNINEKYLYYYYLALDNNKMLKPLYTGLRKVINTDTFLRTVMPYPDKIEQDKIVKYLDNKLLKIDKLIRTKRKQIVLLKEQKQAIIDKVVTKGLNQNIKMKESGIEWVGDIPENWSVCLNKRLFRENNRNNRNNLVGDEIQLSLSQVDGLIPSTQMKERSLQTSTYNNWKIVLPGDLVLNRFKAHLGVFFCAKLTGIVTFHYGVYEPIIELNSMYYEYLYHSNPYRCIYAGKSNGMTVGLQNLSNQNFYNVYTLYPPLEEQNRIVAYIENNNNKINKVISDIEKEIQLFEEYKTTIIYDVVTGKVDIRNMCAEDIDECSKLDEIKIELSLYE